jgi:signal transduction histidine kinase
VPAAEAKTTAIFGSREALILLFSISHNLFAHRSLGKTPKSLVVKIIPGIILSFEIVSPSKLAAVLMFPTATAPAAEFLGTLLDLSRTAAVCYLPVTDNAGQIVDFAFVYLNPAAQQLFALGPHPPTTYLQHFPSALVDGTFAFQCSTFLVTEPRYFDRNCLDEDYDAYCRLAGQRLGQTLLVSFTGAGEQERTQVQGLPQSWEQTVLAQQQIQLLNEEYATANEELREANQQLQRVNEDLDTFLYMASHDLKAPIANIEGLLLVLQDELPPPTQAGETPYLLHLMQQAVERFGRTIGNLTEMVNLQRPKSQEPIHIAFAQLVHEVLLDLTPLIQQTAAQVEVLVPTTLTIRFSEKNLRSVVFNLLSNALKYHQPDRQPSVRVHYLPKADHQAFIVEDNGLGIDLVKGSKKVFAMFERLHDHVEGAGVGLYMVKRMLENVGGRIEVQSTLGQGSTFTVYFPR